MTTAAPGVLRRPRADVPFTPIAISVMRPVRDHGQFIVDASFDAKSEIEEQKAEIRERMRRSR